MIVALWMWISLTGCFGPSAGAASAAVAPLARPDGTVAIDTGGDTGIEAASRGE